MNRKLHLGISPCPNDTFVFHGLLQRKVPTFGLELEIELADVEELNERLARGDFDCAKASFHAALRLSQATLVLPVGAALGFGVGPLLLARAQGETARTRDEHAAQRAGGATEIARDARVLCPGEWTTAHLLYRLFHPEQGRVTQAVFSSIIPELLRGNAEYGVCIHEARFTWRAHGLELVEDLGERWERHTRAAHAPRGVALPLGGLLARRELSSDVLERLTRAIRASLEYAHAHRAEALLTMRAHAQEQADDVLWAHVALYVNECTRALGAEGEAALRELARLARTSGLISGSHAPLEVFDGAQCA